MSNRFLIILSLLSIFMYSFNSSEPSQERQIQWVTKQVTGLPYEVCRVISKYAAPRSVHLELNLPDLQKVRVHAILSPYTQKQRLQFLKKNETPVDVWVEKIYPACKKMSFERVVEEHGRMSNRFNLISLALYGLDKIYDLYFDRKQASDCSNLIGNDELGYRFIISPAPRSSKECDNTAFLRDKDGFKSEKYCVEKVKV